ncbi:MAG: T9SS type A sorting domain-containing protein [Bacteroidota bacterium]
MKKIYFLIFSIFTLSQANAQTYTLTAVNNQPVIGDSYGALNVDTNSVTLPMDISGAGVTWSITSLTLTDSIIALNTFSTASTYSNSSNYPGTNLVQYDSTTITYFNSSANMMELLGVDAGQFDLNYNAGSATIASYPMPFGFLNTDNSVGGTISASTPFGAAAGTFTGTVVTQVDGTGTLNLNNVSNFTNCVRLKTVQNISFDLTSPFPASGTVDLTVYNFYNSSSKFPLFTANYSHLQLPIASIDQVQAQISILSSVVIGVKENKLKNDVIFKTYPNPANNEINVHFVLAQRESYSLEISNTLGQVVKTVVLNNLQPGMYNETINTADLSAGIYTVKVSGKHSAGTEKLVIQK